MKNESVFMLLLLRTVKGHTEKNSYENSLNFGFYAKSFPYK